MKKNYFLLLFTMICFTVKSNAQTLPCATDIVRQRLLAQHPEMLKTEAALEKEIQERLKKIDYSKAARTTGFVDESGNPDFWYDIPIVVHIIHDFGAEYLSDDSIYEAFKDWNLVYSKQNYDTAYVIKTYQGFIPNSDVRYIGNAHIRLHFATIDPNGNPTKGVTRHRSYLTYTGGEPSKLDDWPPSSYVNIWTVNTMSAGNQEAAAYALEPAGAVSDPEGDGIICLYNYFANAYDGSALAVSKTINHEMGHVFNLYHPWGNDNAPQVALGDDQVDDTPPTWGHFLGGCDTTDPSSDDNSLYDTMFATNYFVVYPSSTPGVDSLVNYPDTTNAQNIMDYTYCSRMFTNGQCARMHAALNSDVAGRNNLWDSTNLSITGALVPFPDYKPIPDYSATLTTGSTTLTNYKTRVNYFTFPNSSVLFNNETWNDTVTNLLWTFTVGTSAQTSTNLTAANVQFTQSGWVNLNMQASGNHTGDSTRVWPRAEFVSSPSATLAEGYVQEFGGSDTAQWPMFNYYNNEFKWQMATVGYDDNNSVEYLGFDTRIDVPDNIFPLTGQPAGDFDDLFSVPFDLTSFGNNPCYLNFYYSGASRTSTTAIDEMDIDYATKTSTGMTQWLNLTKIKGGLDNKGAVSTSYVPSSAADWATKGFNVPPAARTAYTVFRFRYLPGNDPATNNSGGNNFYLDRINFSSWPAIVNNVNMGNVDVALVPNPTSGDAFVIVKDADNTIAQVIVTDITGKVVYKTSEQVSGNEAKIQIPHSAISVQGMYIVQTITGNQAHTQKLVVE